MLHDGQRILVTGGAGFIGAHLCRRLLGEGAQVTCLDDFSTGRRANIAALLAHPRFALIERDVCLPIALDVDAIYNLACPASPPAYQADPVRTLCTSVLGAMSVLTLARACGARVLQASTSEVYGDPQVHPQPESYPGHVSTTGPRACYDEGKRAAETLFADHRRRHGVLTRIVRIFNTYGPGMRPDDGRVVSNFIVQALRGEDITLYGEGRQTRSFCYVEDLLEGLVRAMNAGPGLAGPVNLGNPAEIAMEDLALLIVELVNSRSRIVRGPLPEDDPRQRRPDIALARRTLGWEPRTALTEGLSRTIAYFEAQLSSRPAASPARMPALT